MKMKKYTASIAAIAIVMTFVKADGKAYYAGDNFMGRISEDNAEAVLSNLCRDEIEAEAVVEEAEACEM